MNSLISYIYIHKGKREAWGGEMHLGHQHIQTEFKAMGLGKITKRGVDRGGKKSNFELLDLF